MLLRAMPNGKRPFWTYGFVAVCVAVYLIDCLSAFWLYGWQMGHYNGILTQWGMRYNPAIAYGQYWRLLTPMFLHSGVMHLVMNMFALLVWGPMVEYMYSGPKYALILVGASVLGCLAGFAFSSYTAVGASAAVYGMMGAILSIRKHNRLFFERFFGTTILVYVVISIAMGFLQGSVDNLGHIGGLIGGYLLGVASGFGAVRAAVPVRIGAVLAFLLLGAVGMMVGLARF